jgi:hypothetical protein
MGAALPAPFVPQSRAVLASVMQPVGISLAALTTAALITFPSSQQYLTSCYGCLIWCRLMAGGRAWLHSTPSASQHKVGSSSSDLLGKPCHSQL